MARGAASSWCTLSISRPTSPSHAAHARLRRRDLRRLARGLREVFCHVRHHPRWLEIGGTINVNRFHGGNELGTPSEPYRTVNAAYNLARDNMRLKIKAGSYNERVTFFKPMTILADGGTVTIGR